MKVHTSCDLPVLAHIRQTEVEFAEMPWGILLILPVCSTTLPANATLVSLPDLRDEPVVGLVRRKTTSKVHLIYFFALEDTDKSLRGYTVLECWYDPVDRKGTAPRLAVGFLQFERIALKVCCWFLSRSIVAPFLRY
jgi:hypothetical protein